MGRKYRLYQVDSFTKELFKGNPAGVVSNADGLSVDEMQSIARELKNSETAFILNPSADDHEVWIRFFTPSTEVPICGHATIAAHYIRALENKYDTRRVFHKTGAGILPVDIIRINDGDYKIYMTQRKLEFHDPLSDSITHRIFEALGLRLNNLDERCPVQIASTGHSKVMIGIKSLAVLNSLNPDMGMLSKISNEIKCNGYFVFTLDSDEEDILTKGRMFAPAIGIKEDPVTGNADGPLGAYLIKHNIVSYSGNTFSYKGKQGEAINRTGIIEVEVELIDNEPYKVRIGGEATIVYKTEIEL